MADTASLLAIASLLIISEISNISTINVRSSTKLIGHRAGHWLSRRGQIRQIPLSWYLVDLALAAVGLGVLRTPVLKRLADQDLAALEINVLPLEAVRLAGTNAGEEAKREVLPRVES